LGVKSDYDLFPPFFYDKQVGVVTPGSNGQEVKLSNPLRRYHFQGVEKLDDPNMWDPRQKLSDTVRSWTWGTGVETSKYDHPRTNLVAGFRNIRESLVLILSSYKRFGPFSNKRAPDKDQVNKGETWGSLEGVHDLIHGSVGENGHLGTIAYAAFDPVFWLQCVYLDSASSSIC